MTAESEKGGRHFPTGRMFVAVVLTLFAIAWHQLLYHLGLVEDNVNEHYRKLTEDR